MATVTDIKKLRPELLTKSVAELERQRAEIEMALAEKAREAEVKAKEELAADANKHIDAILSGVKFLHENGLLPAKVATGFSGSSGSFAPSMFLRSVTAEGLVPRAAKVVSGGEKKRRRRRQADGSWAPSKASQEG